MFELFAPTVEARVKEPDDFVRVWIAAGQVWSLVEVALVAGERQIIERIHAAMFARIDVLDMERMGVVMFLPKPAIFTAVPGALPHLLAECQAHQEAA